MQKTFWCTRDINISSRIKVLTVVQFQLYPCVPVNGLSRGRTIVRRILGIVLCSSEVLLGEGSSQIRRYQGCYKWNKSRNKAMNK